MEIGAEERIDDNCIILRHPTSPDLLLVFCAVNVEPGKIPAEDRLFHPKVLGCNVVVVNDSSKSWYLNGIPKLGTDCKETLEFLESIKKKLLGENGVFMCYGNSMGAYGAILYGSQLNADFILTPGLESLVCNPVGNAIFWVKGKYSRPDLRSIISNSSSLIHILSGEECPGDYIGLYRLQDLDNVFIQMVTNMQHGVTAYMVLKFDERALIKDYFQRVREFKKIELTMDPDDFRKFRKKYFFRNLVYETDAGAILDNKKAGVYLYSTHIMLQIRSINKNYEIQPDAVRKRIAILQEIMKSTSNSTIKSYILYAIGRLKHRYLKDRQGLIEACNSAYALNTSSRSIPQYLSSLYLAIKNWPECLYWANEAISNRRFMKRPGIEKPSSCYREFLEACENLFSESEQEAFIQFAKSWKKIRSMPEMEALDAYITKHEKKDNV